MTNLSMRLDSGCKNDRSECTAAPRQTGRVMGMTAPLVSICISTYDSTGTLGESIKSIVPLAFSGLNFVICDDASSDGKVELTNRYARQFSFIRVVPNEQNLGVDRNFVRTVQHATGAYA